VTAHDRKYWQYEYDVAARYLVPLLRSWGVQPAGCAVLDVGCGEGGGLCALADAGGTCAGFDVDTGRIDSARTLKGERAIDFRTGDIYADGAPFEGKTFNLVTLHDVFEHLERKREMLDRIAGYLAPGGKLLITFPPYYSAYGAHQQHIATWYARLPFFHLVPTAMSRLIPRLKGEAPHVLAECNLIGKVPVFSFITDFKRLKKLFNASQYRYELHVNPNTRELRFHELLYEEIAIKFEPQGITIVI
jgi:SAM-dependent methyltransferase